MTTWNDVMNAVLPPTNGKVAHSTSWFGVRRDRGSFPHRGIDFNYIQGQSGINLTHPKVRSPITGKVISVGGDAYNTISIRDSNGYVHNVLHTQDQFVQPGQQIRAGDVIGTMGGVGAGDVQHVHYGMRDPNGRLINPADYWSGDLGTLPPPLLGQPVPYLEQTQAAERMLGNKMGWLGAGWNAFNNLGSGTAWPISRSVGEGLDTANDPARFGSPRSDAARPIPYLDATRTAQRLFGGVPSTDFPVYPPWVDPGDPHSPVNPQLPNTPPMQEKKSAAPGGPASAILDPNLSISGGLESWSDNSAGRDVEPMRGAQRNFGRATESRKAVRPIGLVSGEPMPDWLLTTPIWDLMNRP
ncbi:M23 family metallopeptidase [uncultured Bradyrhizobium sp.]|uniref:M23 family metallopeptidase n=1 Tax=uncultured Bradyrhizobium sp. TaxID=199684 RepID=UPI00263685AD|nr:M23 family metallopeptidase [uncultured Bradyrhizobium sp.]